MQNKSGLDKNKIMMIVGAAIWAVALALRAVGAASLPEWLSLAAGAAPNFAAVFLGVGAVPVLYPLVFKKPFPANKMHLLLAGILILAVAFEFLFDYLRIWPVDFLDIAVSAAACFIINILNTRFR